MLPRMTFSQLLAAPPLLRRLLSWLLGRRRWVRPGWHWLSRYPLLLAMTAALLAIVWGCALTDFDAFHIVWHEQYRTGAAGGVTLALVLAGFWYATYLIDRARARRNARMLGSSERGVRWLPYLLWWSLSLLVFALPAALPGNWTAGEPWPDGLATRWSFPTGLVGVWILLTGLVFATAGRDRPRLLHAIGIVGYGTTIVLYIGLALFQSVSVLNFCPIYSTAVNFLLLVGFLGSLYSLMLWAAARWRFVDRLIYPILLSLVVPWLLNAILALLALAALVGAALAGGPARRRLAAGLVALAVLLLVVIVRPGTRETEHRLPYMNYTDESGHAHDYYDEPVSLFLADPEAGGDPAKWKPQRQAAERALRHTDAGLIESPEKLENWRRHIARPNGYFPGQTRPAFVVMVSGGASTSALYSARVLFDMETLYPGFGEQIVLISGASGGMVGAAYYVVHCQPGGIVDELRRTTHRYFERCYYPYQQGRMTQAKYQADSDAYDAEVAALREQFLAGLRADFLTPLVQKYVFKDISFNYFQRHTDNDRGRALETTWDRHLRGAVDPQSHRFDRTRPAFDVPFSSLRAAERAALIPSLVFSPMMIEDGRQLLISNLDLDGLVEAESKSVAHPALAAIEFARLFPRAQDFRLGTAVRLNASFPFFSPAATLPTNPCRRVVDAGYYDNYGANVALKWIAANEDTLRRVTGVEGVKLLPIYTYGYEANMDVFTTVDEDARYAAEGGLVCSRGGYHSATAPVEGLFASWRANMVYRVEDRIGYLERWMNRDAYTAPWWDPKPLFLERIHIPGPVDPPMNWYLRRAEIERIEKNYFEALQVLRVVKMRGTSTERREKTLKASNATQAFPGLDAAKLTQEELADPHNEKLKEMLQSRPNLNKSVDKLIRTMPRK